MTGGSSESVCMVMDCLDYDLKALMGAMGAPFAHAEVKCLLLQLLRALAHMHARWVVHRDLKTSNLLFKGGVLNVCDFGMARFYADPVRKMSSAVVTLWYARAPSPSPSPVTCVVLREMSSAVVTLWYRTHRHRHLSLV